MKETRNDEVKKALSNLSEKELSVNSWRFVFPLFRRELDIHSDHLYEEGKELNDPVTRMTITTEPVVLSQTKSLYDRITLQDYVGKRIKRLETPKCLVTGKSIIKPIKVKTHKSSVIRIRNLFAIAKRSIPFLVLLFTFFQRYIPFGTSTSALIDELMNKSNFEMKLIHVLSKFLLINRTNDDLELYQAIERVSYSFVSFSEEMRRIRAIALYHTGILCFSKNVDLKRRVLNNPFGMEKAVDCFKIILDEPDNTHILKYWDEMLETTRIEVNRTEMEPPLLESVCIQEVMLSKYRKYKVVGRFDSSVRTISRCLEFLDEERQCVKYLRNYMINTLQDHKIVMEFVGKYVMNIYPLNKKLLDYYLSYMVNQRFVIPRKEVCELLWDLALFFFNFEDEIRIGKFKRTKKVIDAMKSLESKEFKFPRYAELLEKIDRLREKVSKCEDIIMEQFIDKYTDYTVDSRIVNKVEAAVELGDYKQVLLLTKGTRNKGTGNYICRRIIGVDRKLGKIKKRMDLNRLEIKKGLEMEIRKYSQFEFHQIKKKKKKK